MSLLHAAQPFGTRFGPGSPLMAEAVLQEQRLATAAGEAAMSRALPATPAHDGITDADSAHPYDFSGHRYAEKSEGREEKRRE